MAMLAMLRSPPAAAAVVAAGKAAAATMAAGKAAEAAATEEVDVGGKHVRGGKGTNEVGGGSAAAAGGDGSSARAAEGSTAEARCYRCGKKGHWRADCTEELCNRCQGRTANVCPASAEKRCSRCNGRGHAADICPSPKDEAVLAMSNDDDDDGTVQASAFKAEETGECSYVLGRMGEGESAWQVDDAWLCDSGASTHMTPSADCMINYRECNLKLRIADGSTRSIEGYEVTVAVVTIQTYTLPGSSQQ